MAEVKKVKRSLFAQFIDTSGSAAASPVWSRMGKGISAGEIDYGAEVTEETYIHEDNSTSEIDSYKPSLDTEQIAYAGDPVFDYVDSIRQLRGTGNECKTKLLLVYLYDGDPTEGYAAEQNDCAIEITSFGGDGGSNLYIKYNIHLNGDPVLGKVKVTDGQPVFS